MLRHLSLEQWSAERHVRELVLSSLAFEKRSAQAIRADSLEVDSLSDVDVIVDVGLFNLN